MSDALARGWDEAAEGYEAYYVPRFAPWVTASVDALVAGPLPDGPILVPACGTFPELDRLDEACPGRPLVGVDLSAGMVRRARERAAGRASVTVVQGDATVVGPQWLQAYAGVVSVFGLQQMPDPEAALRAWVTALRPGGRLAVCFWPHDTEDDGPFAVLAAALRGRRPPADRSWEVRLVTAITDAGGLMQSDERPVYAMTHADAGSFFDAYVWSGPMRATATARGPEFVAATRAEFVRRSPDGPLTHHPAARLLVAEMPGR